MEGAEVNLAMKQYLCVDIDNSAIRYSVLSEELDILDSGRITVGMENKEQLFTPLIELAKGYRGRVEGMSITMPGVIDMVKGMAYSGGVFRWVHNEPYGEELSQLSGMRTVIANDAKAAGMAEIGYGSLKGIDNGIMLLILGGGIGGVIVHHGQMMEGAHYAAGEVSYMRGDYKERDGAYCMFAETNSINSLAKCVKEETGSGNTNVIRIMMKLQMHDEAVLKGVRKYCDWMADYIYNVQCVVDASRVVIGGNIDDPAFIEMIKQAVRRRFDSVPYHVIWEPEVVESTFHSDARMFGAVYNFRHLKTTYYDG